MITPYDDNEMEYDGKLKRYVLTKTGVINNVFLESNALTNFKNMSNAKLFLQEISEDIYQYILTHKFVFDRKFFQQVVNTDNEFREPLKRAMMYQVRYAFRSGGTALKDMTGVDIERGRIIALDNIRGDIGISPSAITELKSAGLLDVRQIHGRWR